MIHRNDRNENDSFLLFLSHAKQSNSPIAIEMKYMKKHNKYLS